MIKRPKHRRAGRGRHGKLGGGLNSGKVRGIGLGGGKRGGRKKKIR